MTTREDFEKWATGADSPIEAGVPWTDTRVAWESWQAATAQRDAEIAELLDLLERYAESDCNIDCETGGVGLRDSNLHRSAVATLTKHRRGM